MLRMKLFGSLSESSKSRAGTSCCRYGVKRRRRDGNCIEHREDRRQRLEETMSVMRVSRQRVREEVEMLRPGCLMVDILLRHVENILRRRQCSYAGIFKPGDSMNDVQY